jgi:hypothetical protein
MGRPVQNRSVPDRPGRCHRSGAHDSHRLVVPFANLTYGFADQRGVAAARFALLRLMLKNGVPPDPHHHAFKGVDINELQNYL